jgi:hypothetical protein
LSFVADLNFGFAFQDYVEFVLSGVRVGGVLLAGFEAVESGEEGVAAGDVGLRHFLGGEFGVIGETLDDHLGGGGYA